MNPPSPTPSPGPAIAKRLDCGAVPAPLSIPLDIHAKVATCRRTPNAAAAAEPIPVHGPNPEPTSLPPTRPEPNASTDLLILSDGTVYARNLTPELAAVLASLNPHDATLARRASATLRFP